MMTQDRAQRIASEWIEAWNAHDLDRIASHYAADVELTSPMIVQVIGERSGTIRGRDDLRRYFAEGLSRYPDLRFELIEVLTGVRSLTLYYRSVRDLLTVETMEVDGDGLIYRVLAHYKDLE